MPRFLVFCTFLFGGLFARASDCELRLLIQDGVLLKITLGAKPQLSIEAKPVAATPAPAPGFLQRLGNLGNGLGDIARITAIQSAIGHIRKEPTPANHHALLVAMAAYFNDEGITNIKVQKDPATGAYTYLFPDLPPEVTSPSRWLADLNTFLRAATPNQPTVAYISSGEGLDATSEFRRDFQSGETHLSLSEFPGLGRKLFPSTNTAHELFHWLNDWMLVSGEDVGAWPAHQIQLGQDALETLDPEWLTLEPTPLIHSARAKIFEHYVKGGFMVEEVGAYAFQSLLEGALTQELSKGLELAPGAKGLKAAGSYIEFESRGLLGRAYEALRTYDFHLAFAEVSLVAYATFIKQATRGGFEVSLIKDQLIEISLKGGTKVRMYSKKGARELKALYDRDPSKLIAQLMLAVVRIVDESQRLQASLPLLARQTLPIFEYYFSREGDKAIAEIFPTEAQDVRLSEVLSFLRQQAQKTATPSADVNRPFYVFPAWRLKD